MTKRVLFLLFCFSSFFASAQIDVKPNYTKPYFQGNVKIADTLGVDSLIILSDSATIVAANGGSKIDLRYSGVDGNIIIEGGSTKIQLNGASDRLDFTAGEFTDPHTSFFTQLNSNISFSVFKNDFSKFGILIVGENDGADLVSGNFPTYPTISATQNGVVNQGVINSMLTSGLNTIGKTNNTTYANQYGFNIGGAFETILSHTTATHDNNIIFPDTSGTIAMLHDISGTGIYGGSDSIPTNTTARVTDVFEIEKGTNIVTYGGLDAALEIEVASSRTLLLYKNKIGGSVIGDNVNLNFAYNDVIGNRIIAPTQISTRVASLAAAGSLNATMHLADLINLRAYGTSQGVLIRPSGATNSITALLDVTGESGFTPNVLFNLKHHENGTQSVITATNSSNNNVLLLRANGQTFFNLHQLSTGDFNIRGLTDTELFFADVSADAIGIGTDAPLTKLDITFPETGLDPLSFYEDNVGGAILGDTYSIDSYFNDSNGNKTKGTSGSIINRVRTAPSVGLVPTSLILGNILNIDNAEGVLIHPTATTQGATAFLDVRQTAGSSFNVALQITAKGNTSSQNAIITKNLNGDNLFTVEATGKTSFNFSKLSTGDVRMSGGVDANVFYMDASSNSVGIGTATPASTLEVNGTISNNDTTNFKKFCGGLVEETTSTVSLTTDYTTINELEAYPFNENLTTTDSTVTVPVDGFYIGSMNMSFSYSGGAATVEGALFVNDVEATGFEFKRDISNNATGAVGISFNGLKLDESDILKIKVKVSTGSGTMTVETFQASISRIN